MGDFPASPPIQPTMGKEEVGPISLRRKNYQDVMFTAWLTLRYYLKRRKHLCYTERIEVFFLLLMMLSIVLECNARSLGVTTGNLFRLMVDGKKEIFYSQLSSLAVFVTMSSLYISAKTYCTGCLARLLRSCLTEALNDKYFGSGAFYRLNQVVDNPDQRITADVNEFCASLIATIDKFVLSPVLVIIYSNDAYKANGFPALFLVYIFFGVGVILQRFIMPKLVKLTARLDNLEGDFRFSHAAVRNESEPIFLSRTGGRFRKDVESSFSQIYEHLPLVLSLQFMMNVIGNFFAFVGGVINYVILYYTADFSTFTAAEISEFISQGSFTTLYLISKLSEFVQIGSHLSGMTAHASRIAEFCKLTDERDYIRQWETDQDRKVTVPTLLFSGLDIVSPDEQCHIKGFDLRITQGQHVYITGPNGSGKTSLVRILMRLWKPTRGRVAVLGNASISCAPQEPIIYSGTLLEQLGLDNDHGNNDEACRILMAVKLASLPHRTGGINRFWPRNRWMEMLSPGEMQRLVLARVLLESPSFAILDEATSAVDLPTERVIYEEFWRRGITTLTIGHRMEPTLMEQIAIQVTLDGNGGHAIRRKGEELVFTHTGRRSTPGCRSDYN